jgi:hypothetical protein
VPIAYTIDQARNLVMTVATGTLGDADLMQHKQALRDDPRVSVDVKELSVAAAPPEEEP